MTEEQTPFSKTLFSNCLYTAFILYIYKGMKEDSISLTASVEIQNDVMERADYEEDITTGFRNRMCTDLKWNSVTGILC